MPDDVPAAVKKRRRHALLTRQKRVVAALQRARKGQTVDVLVDGVSPEHELVLRGRLEGQAPDIDSQVYLSDCDPAQHAPGDLIRATLIDARGYDWIASVASG
jgi:ribosomal protein S12 methylthiotransferase